MKVDKISQRKIKYMLDNAGDIQYYRNILNSSLCAGFKIEDVLYMYDGFNFWLIGYETDSRGDIIDERYWLIERKIALFLLKGRKLRSGLATPMARYYGHLALEKYCEQQ